MTEVGFLCVCIGVSVLLVAVVWSTKTMNETYASWKLRARHGEKSKVPPDDRRLQPSYEMTVENQVRRATSVPIAMASTPPHTVIPDRRNRK